MARRWLFSLAAVALLTLIGSSATLAQTAEHRFDAAAIRQPGSTATGPTITWQQNSSTSYPQAEFPDAQTTEGHYRFWKHGTGTTANLDLYVEQPASNTQSTVWSFAIGCWTRAPGTAPNTPTFGAAKNGTLTFGGEASAGTAKLTVTGIAVGGTPADGDPCVLKIIRLGNDAVDNFTATAKVLEARLIEQ